MDYLDFLFADRNKAYGAYALRRAYGRHLQQAWFTMLALVSIAVWASGRYPQAGRRLALPPVPPRITEVCMCAFPDLGPVRPQSPAPPLPAGKRYWLRESASLAVFVPPVVLEDTIVLDGLHYLPPKRELLSDTAAVANGRAAADRADTLPPGDTVLHAVPADDTSAFVEAIVEFIPTFPGGDAALQAYLRKNLRLRDSSDVCHSALVVVSFVVDRHGDLIDPTVIHNRGGNPACADEALRVVRSMPCWDVGPMPAWVADTRMILPIRFSPD